MLPFIIAGLAIGSVYSLAGVGLVLTYKTSGIFNFAQGAVATIGAYLFYSFFVLAGMPWPVALALCIVIAGPLLGLIFEWVARGLATSSLVVRTVSTIGILLIVQGAALLVFGTEANRLVPQFLPTGGLAIVGAYVRYSDAIVVVIALLATVGLACFFRFARLGLSMRAVVDSPDLVDLMGTNPDSVRRWAWVIGSTFAIASGVLLAPLVSLNATTLTLLVVQAFGAAAIGRFKNIGLTYVGGLILGVASSLAAGYFPEGPLSGLSAALPFVVLFLVLLLSSKKSLAERTSLQTRSTSTWTTPPAFQIGAAIVLVVFFALVPAFAGYRLTDWTLTLTYAISLLSLGLLVKTSGQVSLAQMSFMAIGATAMSHLVLDLHIPWPIALVLAGLIAVPVGALLSIPAIRLSGLYLALATFGFGILVSVMFYGLPIMFGQSGVGVLVPRPDKFGIDFKKDVGFYYLVLALTILAAICIVALTRSRLGRLLRALADSPTGLSTSGTSVNVTRVIVFCIATFVAAVAGALGGAAQGTISAESYAPLISLTLFALVVISPGGAPWYAIVGAAGFTLVPSYIPNPQVANFLTLLFGIFAIVYAMTPDERRGAPDWLVGLTSRQPARRPKAIHVTPMDRSSVESQRVAAGLLEAQKLTVRFGGVVAADNVSLAVQTGQITGLIGPNGAGKSTTFNALSGLNKPSNGTVKLDGHDISRVGPAGRARLGLGRTFQQMELFDSQTVRQNVAMGKEAGLAGAHPIRQVFGGRKQAAAVRASAITSMELCGISHLAERSTGSLSTGQRRLVELARSLAGGHRILLLDEPSSGLDVKESEEFGRVLQSVVAERGIGILLVEHDMALVKAVCDYIYVLDFGKQIFEGRAADVMNAAIVKSAYLGSNESEELEELANDTVGATVD